jgi:basic membrane protein A and related proteins
MIEAGADVMYAERFGVSDAAQERGVLAIGNVIDTQAEYPDTVVASAIWHFEPTLDRASPRARGGLRRRRLRVYSHMIHGGCSMAPLGTFEGRVPDEVMALVAQREAEILAGAFVVEINDDEPTLVVNEAKDGAQATVLRLDRITKRFGALTANDAIA